MKRIYKTHYEFCHEQDTPCKGQLCEDCQTKYIWEAARGEAEDRIYRALEILGKGEVSGLPILLGTIPRAIQILLGDK